MGKNSLFSATPEQVAAALENATRKGTAVWTANLTERDPVKEYEQMRKQAEQALAKLPAKLRKQTREQLPEPPEPGLKVSIEASAEFCFGSGKKFMARLDCKDLVLRDGRLVQGASPQEAGIGIVLLGPGGMEELIKPQGATLAVTSEDGTWTPTITGDAAVAVADAVYGQVKSHGKRQEAAFWGWATVRTNGQHPHPNEAREAILAGTQGDELNWTVQLDEQEVPGTETTIGTIEATAEVEQAGEKFILWLKARDMTGLREFVKVQGKVSSRLKGKARRAAEKGVAVMKQRLEKLLKGRTAQVMVVGANGGWRHGLPEQDAKAIAVEVCEYAKRQGMANEAAFLAGLGATPGQQRLDRCQEDPTGTP
jgi:hypothetical protein